MIKFKHMYQSDSTVYLLVIALILVALIGGKATHQGMVLGLVAILVGLIIIYRTTRNPLMSIINAVVFCALECTACIVVAFCNDPTELWFASFYAVFGILMVLELIMKRFVVLK